MTSRGRWLATLGIVMLALVARSAGAGPLWISDIRLGASLLAIDPATGARTVVDLDRYPLVIEVGEGVEAPTGELYLEAVNAAQSNVVIRFDPADGSIVGVSGDVDAASNLPRGSGPDFEPGLVGLEIGPWGQLYALRQGGGPMSVDILTGDRMVVSQSAAPEVGHGVALIDPVDLVAEPRGSLLVADRFGGLVRVESADGGRRVVYVFEDLVEGPHRLARLPDGRVVHALGAGDGRSITVFDRALVVAAELSGPGRGAGPGFGGIVDLVATADGTIYVLDPVLPAVLAVDPVTGNRRLVAEDPGGDDLGQLSPLARFVSPAWVHVPPSPRRASGRTALP